MANDYPFEMKREVPENSKGEKLQPIVRVGPKGYAFPENFKNIASDIYNIEVRSSDVFVFSFPRSGTTWTQELVWLVLNDLDYEAAAKTPLTERYLFLEFSMIFDEGLKEKLYEANKHDEDLLKDAKFVSDPVFDLIKKQDSPRFFKSHLPLSLLPPSALKAKMVHVARDPRDAMLSFYHLMNSMTLSNLRGDFKDFWEAAIKDLHSWTPYFENVKESWEMRDHPNLLFLFYEDMRKDLPSAVRRVCDFFGKKYNNEQIARLCDHLSFESFKNNPSVNYDLMKELGLMKSDKEFVRKGKSGGWRENFDEEMTAQAEKWIADNLKDTDMKFPSMQ
ncbi:unnamed protein product [Leptosia nina]|uniref:Sulfotransferase domain-containing protein n=1 Tax=Leptosia nina TaxID=320188 RepID=A0AAV1JB25_9NEOP